MICFNISMPSCLPQIIAHRGNSAACPENTFASVNSAWHTEADAAEIDVRVSKDNKIMIIHDENTLRTTGEDHAVRETYACKLHSLDAGSYKSVQYAGEPIPYLSDILKLLPSGKKLYIEWKADPRSIPLLAEMMLKFSCLDRIHLIALHPGALEYCLHFVPEMKTFWVIGEIQPPTEHILKRIAQYCKHHGIHGVDVFHESLTLKAIDYFHTQGLPVLTWTVNTPQDAQKYASWGIDGITTDDPETIKKHLYV